MKIFVGEMFDLILLLQISCEFSYFQGCFPRNHKLRQATRRSPAAGDLARTCRACLLALSTLRLISSMRKKCKKF